MSEKEYLVASKNAVHAIIYDENNNYLFQLRDDKKKIFYPLHWGVFGGGMEPDETEKNCLKRELNEELSITIDEKQLFYFTKFQFDLSFKNLNKIFVSYFEYKINNEMKKNISLNEGIKYEFFKASDFLKMSHLVPLDAFAIWLHSTKNEKFI